MCERCGKDVETRKYTFLPYVQLRPEVPPNELYWPKQVTGSLGKKIPPHGGLQRSPAPKAYSSPSKLPPRTDNCQGVPLSGKLQSALAAWARLKPRALG